MLYPNNDKEVRKVENYIKTKNNDMHNFIKLTDPDVSYTFVNIVDEDINYLKKMTQNIVIYIFLNSFLIEHVYYKLIQI